MLGKLARGMVLFILATLIVVYIFSGDGRPPTPVPPNTIIGYMSA